MLELPLREFPTIGDTIGYLLFGAFCMFSVGYFVLAYIKYLWQYHIKKNKDYDMF